MFSESITPQEIEKLEYASFPGKIYVIDTVGSQFNRAIAYLKEQKIIGFDTETRPVFSQDQPKYGVALLQLSGPDKAFLFRINKIGLHRRLCNLLASDKVIKVGAAIHDDIRGLQRKHDFSPAAFVDLQKIVCEWGIRDKSVKKMAGIILGFRISKPSSFPTGKLKACPTLNAGMLLQMPGCVGKCISDCRQQTRTP